MTHPYLSGTATVISRKQDMVFVRGNAFRMGSDDHYPKKRLSTACA